MNGNAQDGGKALWFLVPILNGHVAQLGQRRTQHSDTVQHSQSGCCCRSRLPNRQWWRGFSLGTRRVADASLLQKDGFDNVHGLVHNGRCHVRVCRRTRLSIIRRDFVVDGILVGNLRERGRDDRPVDILFSGHHHHAVLEAPNRIPGSDIRRVSHHCRTEFFGIFLSFRLETSVILIDASKGNRLAGFSVGIDVGKTRLERSLHQIGVHAASDLFGSHHSIGGMPKVVGKTRWFVPVGRA
mmetsp:Transcript_14567/g.36602  ORF Transcript_14567/g.36602 Transcript_14567/m.36602 type:complete len:241 (+) Transcript_14567:930-1652(+)